MSSVVLKFPDHELVLGLTLSDKLMYSLLIHQLINCMMK